MNAPEKDVREIELKIENINSKSKNSKQYFTQVDKEDNTYQYDGNSVSKNPDIPNSIIDKGRQIEESTPKVVELVIDEIFEQLGINWYNMRIYIIMSLFFLADGAEMIVISLLITKLGQQWNLSHTEKGIMGSAVFVGFFIGALISGKMSDTKGRKPTFIIGSLIVCIFSTLSAFSMNYYWFLILRALNGFGIGMCIPSSTSLATEITPTAWRAWVLNMVWIFFPFGEIFAVFIAREVLDASPHGWRYLLGFAALPTILAFIISFFIFESPKFYLATKQYDKAYSGINRIFKIKNLPEITEEVKAKIFKQNEESNKNNIKPDFKTLLKKEYIGITLKCCFIFYISSFIYYGIVYILPQTMESVARDNSKNATFENSTFTSNSTSDNDDYNMTDYDRNQMYTGLIFSALSEIPSTIITGYIANIPALGRIKSMALGFLITALASIICGLFLNYLSITASLLKFAIDIPFGIIYIYVSEAFPTKIRTIAIGVTNSFNRIGGISTPIFSQLAFSFSIGMPYYMYAIVSFIGAAISLSLPFETLGMKIS